MTDAASSNPAVRFSRLLRAEGPVAVAAALGFGGPVALGLAAGHVSAGLAAATGALMAGGAGLTPGGAGGPARAGPRRLGLIAMGLAAPLAATLLAQTIAGQGAVTAALVTLTATLACLLGGFSRAAAVMAMRFNVFLMISLGVATGARADHAGGAMLMVGAGLLWMTWLNRAARRMTPPGALKAVEGEGEADPPRPAAPFDRRVAHYMRGLRTRAGWSFAVRVGVCLAVAETAVVLWPDQHLQWIGLTVVLLSTRRAEPGEHRVRDRAVGTAIGVLIAGLLLLWRPTPWELVAGVALIAAVRPFLRARSYMAYSVAMTPLIMLLQDFTTAPHIGLLADRIGATLAGAALVMIGARLFPPPPPQGPRHERARTAAA